MLKRAGFLGVGLAVWGATTFAGGERPGSTPAVAAMPPIMASAPEPAAAPVVEAPRVIEWSQEAPLPQERPQEAPAVTRASAPAPAPATERRGRRSRRNVWVGPIPGPGDWAAPEGPVRIALQAG